MPQGQTTNRIPPKIYIRDLEELPPNMVALPLEITHGRSGTAAQPDAPVAQFTYLARTCPFNLGDPMRIEVALPDPGVPATWGDLYTRWGDPGYSWTGDPLATVTRFVGIIASIVAVESLRELVEWRITAVGKTAQLGRTPIQITRPAETDTERAQAIAAAAGWPITIIGTSNTVLAAETYDRDALGALHELAGWTAGLVWQNRDGALCYGTATHRDTTESGILPAGAVLDGIEWSQTHLEIVNHVTVSWDHANSPRQTTYRDQESIDRWGMHHVDATTRFSNQDDVDIFGYTILGRRAEPWWQIPGIVIDGHTTPDRDYWTSNHLDLGNGVLLDVTSNPDTALNGVAVWTVEGWVERWETDGTRQTLQFAVSDRARWGSYALWTWEQTRALTWATLVGRSWLDVMTGDYAWQLPAPTASPTPPTTTT